jgi:ribosomal protein L34
MLCRKWFWQPKLHKRKRKHGFLKRFARRAGWSAAVLPVQRPG